MRRPARMLAAATMGAVCLWLVAAVPAFAAPAGQAAAADGSNAALLGVLIAAAVLMAGGVLAFLVSRTRQG